MGVTGVLGYAPLDGWHRALLSAGSKPYDLTQQYSLTVVPRAKAVNIWSTEGLMDFALE